MNQKATGQSWSNNFARYFVIADQEAVKGIIILFFVIQVKY